MSVAAKPVWLDLARSADQQKSNPVPNPAAESNPSRLEVYVATRREIFRCTDVDGDLQCDEVKTQLVHPGKRPETIRITAWPDLPSTLLATCTSDSEKIRASTTKSLAATASH